MSSSSTSTGVRIKKRVVTMSASSPNGNRLTKQAVQFVRNVHEYFVREFENQSFLEDPHKVYIRAAEAMRVNRTTIARIVRERNSIVEGTAIFKTPCRQRIREISKSNVDCFVLDEIRRRIYSYYKKAQIPCIMKIVRELNEEGSINGGHNFLRRILYGNGFRYKVYSGRKVLLEKNNIVIKRCHFFKKTKKLNYHSVVWMGESCFIVNPYKKTDKYIKVIVFHAGTSEGFVDKALVICSSKNPKTHFLKEISSDMFLKWFEKVLELIPKGSNIVLNTAACHNADLNRPPNIYCDKKDIIEWLDKSNIPYEESLLKAELLDLVRMAKPILPNYAVENIASEKGFNVIRVPPYHNHFNAIERIWMKIKNEIDRRASLNRIDDDKQLEQTVRSCVTEITEEDWTDAVRKAKDDIQNAAGLEKQLETAIESVFIQIDLTKKSGREDLEVLKFYNDSEGSELYTESSSDEMDQLDFEDNHYCNDITDVDESDFTHHASTNGNS